MEQGESSATATGKGKAVDRGSSASTLLRVSSPKRFSDLEALEPIDERDAILPAPRLDLISSSPSRTPKNRIKAGQPQQSSHFEQEPEGVSKEANSVQPIGTERICGLTPKMFWIVILLIVLLLATGIASGLGAGLSSVRKICINSVSTTLAATSLTYYVACPTQIALQDKSNQVVTVPILTTTPSPVSGLVTPTSAPLFTNPDPWDSIFTPAIQDPTITCPENHGQKITFPYALNGTAFEYTIYCGSNFGAVWNPSISDMQAIPNVQNMTQCLDLCVRYTIQIPNTPSRTAGFGQFCSGIFFSSNTCWLKSGVIAGAYSANDTGDGAVLVRSLSWAW